MYMGVSNDDSTGAMEWGRVSKQIFYLDGNSIFIQPKILRMYAKFSANLLVKLKPANSN